MMAGCADGACVSFREGFDEEEVGICWPVFIPSFELMESGRAWSRSGLGREEKYLLFWAWSSPGLGRKERYFCFTRVEQLFNAYGF
jgi:hypothetical protein